MTSNRTPSETEALRKEAERRARAGESRTDISRAIGAPLHTLARWAFEGRWRQKDLAAEGAADRAAAIERRLTQIRDAQPRPVPGGAGQGRRGGAEVLEFKSREAPPPPPETAEAPGPDFGSLPQCARGYVSRPAGPLPDWAPLLDGRSRDQEPEQVALWLAHDLFMRGHLAEAQRSLRFAASWIGVSRQVWAIEEELEEARWRGRPGEGSSSSSNNNNTSGAWRPASANNSGL